VNVLLILGKGSRKLDSASKEWADKEKSQKSEVLMGATGLELDWGCLRLKFLQAKPEVNVVRLLHNDGLQTEEGPGRVESPGVKTV